MEMTEFRIPNPDEKPDCKCSGQLDLWLCVAEKQLLFCDFVSADQDFMMGDAVPWYHHHRAFG